MGASVSPSRYSQRKYFPTVFCWGVAGTVGEVNGDGGSWR